MPGEYLWQHPAPWLPRNAFGSFLTDRSMGARHLERARWELWRLSKCASMSPAGRRIPARTDRPGSTQPARPNIAVLLDYMDLFGGGVEAGIRDALEELGRELDLNLLLVYGR